MKSESFYYFAYGSNMSSIRIKKRVPSARVICVGSLSAHQLRYHKKSVDGSGKCDAYFTGSSEDVVYGVVFSVKAEEAPTLDRAEGLGKGYDRKEISVEGTDGNTYECQTYVATQIDAALKPYSWYLNHVLSGARENNLPDNYIQQILETAAESDPNRERHEREMNIYL